MVHPSGIAIIGGGIIGTAIAVQLQSRGTRTWLFDGDEPGRGCSYGNAGTIATSFILPLSRPKILLSTPRLILDPRGPLAVRTGDLRALAPWLTRFIANALPVRQRRTIAALRLLNGNALASWRALLGPLGLADHLHERGLLEIAQGRLSGRSLLAQCRALQAVGVSAQMIARGDIAALEPELAGRADTALLHDGVAHVSDPFLLTQALIERYVDFGGEVVREPVSAVLPTESGVRLRLPSGDRDVDQAVLAAGAETPALLAPFALRIPLAIEFGYHLMLPEAGADLKRPVAFHAESFLATPMSGGLRLAGTVELAATASAPDWRRAHQLLPLAKSYLPNLRADNCTQWRGGRTSFPDSLPAIGRVTHAPRILYAFGHQHLGLTQAAITADCIASLALQRAPAFDLSGFALDRFGDGRQPRHVEARA